jgi:hypothetical protein
MLRHSTSLVLFCFASCFLPPTWHHLRRFRTLTTGCMTDKALAEERYKHMLSLFATTADRSSLVRICQPAASTAHVDNSWSHKRLKPQRLHTQTPNCVCFASLCLPWLTTAQHKPVPIQPAYGELTKSIKQEIFTTFKHKPFINLTRLHQEF